MPAAVYSAQVSASFNPGVDSLAIEITAPSNVTLKIKKIRIVSTDGTALDIPDSYCEVRPVRESVAGTGGSTYTPIRLDSNTTAALSTVKTGPFTIGTVSETIDQFSIHSATDFYWSAADEEDKIVIAPSGIFGLVINPAL